MRLFLCLAIIAAGVKHGFINPHDGLQGGALLVSLGIAMIQDIGELRR